MDKLLVSLGLADSRVKVQALILAGWVLVDGVLVTKAPALLRRDGWVLN